MTRTILLIIILSLSTVAANAAITATIDPKLAYYKDRSPESIAEELKANGFGEVHVVCDDISAMEPGLVRALADNGLKVWMQVYINGVYSTANLPEGWQSWKMRLRKEPQGQEFTYLCPNNAEYIKWKRKQIIEALSMQPFYGIDLAGAYFPGQQGPESDDYGCTCEHCAAAFKAMYQSDPPDFQNQDSEKYWKKNELLYEMWAGFRVSSLINSIDDLVNGKGGIREKCPESKVATWSLGLDDPEAINELREHKASDAAGLVRRVKPDVHVIQTDALDWSRPELKSSYPQAYKPITESIHDAAPRTPLALETNLGSKDKMRRQKGWLSDVEKAAKEVNLENVTGYDYSLGDYIYTEPPAIVETRMEAGIAKLIFNKRLDAVVASDASNYSLTAGRIDYVKVDGNMILLSVSDLESRVVLTISNLSDDEPRRMFHDRPSTFLERPLQIILEQNESQSASER